MCHGALPTTTMPSEWLGAGLAHTLFYWRVLYTMLHRKLLQDKSMHGVITMGEEATSLRPLLRAEAVSAVTSFHDSPRCVSYTRYVFLLSFYCYFLCFTFSLFGPNSLC